MGEYLAGGLIIVLGLGQNGTPLKSFTGTGMHGGKIIVRTKRLPESLPPQVSAVKAGGDDMREAAKYLIEFSRLFGISAGSEKKDFFVLKPDAKNPYKKLYTTN